MDTLENKQFRRQKTRQYKRNVKRFRDDIQKCWHLNNKSPSEINKSKREITWRNNGDQFPRTKNTMFPTRTGTPGLVLHFRFNDDAMKAQQEVNQWEKRHGSQDTGTETRKSFKRKTATMEPGPEAVAVPNPPPKPWAGLWVPSEPQKALLTQKGKCGVTQRRVRQRWRRAVRGGCWWQHRGKANRPLSEGSDRGDDIFTGNGKQTWERKAVASLLFWNKNPPKKCSLKETHSKLIRHKKWPNRPAKRRGRLLRACPLTRSKSSRRNQRTDSESKAQVFRGKEPQPKRRLPRAERPSRSASWDQQEARGTASGRAVFPGKATCDDWALPSKNSFSAFVFFLTSPWFKLV